MLPFHRAESERHFGCLFLPLGAVHLTWKISELGCNRRSVIGLGMEDPEVFQCLSTLQLSLERSGASVVFLL